MAKAGDRWRDGRNAWERLTRWRRDASSARDAALDALADVGVVRRLLDQAELAAVRTARGAGSSWAEIATRLGVTRQSAWERWRDVDEEPSGEGSSITAGTASAAAVEGAAANLVRRRSTVRVPNVIGMSWDDARRALRERDLVGIAPDPDAPPPLETIRVVVTDQSPESGARVPHGTAVTLWTDQEGGSGVREPRVPKPVSGVGRAMRQESSEQTA